MNEDSCKESVLSKEEMSSNEKQMEIEISISSDSLCSEDFQDKSGEVFKYRSITEGQAMRLMYDLNWEQYDQVIESVMLADKELEVLDKKSDEQLRNEATQKIEDTWLDKVKKFKLSKYQKY